MARWKLPPWLYSLWLRWLPQRVQVRRRPVQRYTYKPQLEGLEERMLLAANSVESTAGAFMSDAARLQNDVATSALTLVNAVQSSPAAAANQMNKFESVLAADWGRMQQAFVQFESAVLDAVTLAETPVTLAA